MNSDKVIPHILIIYLSGTVHAQRVRLISTCKAWSARGSQIYLLTSQITQELLSRDLNEEKEKINFKVIPLSDSNPQTNLQIIKMFLIRTFLGSIIKVPDSIKIIYSMTGIIPEVFPGFIFKIRHPGLKWVVLVDNLVAPPSRRLGSFLLRVFAYLGFRLTVCLIRKADLVFTTNQMVRNGLIDLGVNPDKIKSTTTGVVMDEINSAVKIENKEYDAVFVGRLYEPKGIFDLLEIWKIVCAQDKNRRLAIIGPSLAGMIFKIREKINSCGLDSNIDLIGYVGDREKFGIMKSSKIFVFPSHEEARPLVVMEAMACGLPVVLYDLEVFKELYPDGLVQKAPFKDFKTFAEKALLLLREDKTREELAGRGRDYVRHFSWGNIVNNEYGCIKEYLFGKGY